MMITIMIIKMLKTVTMKMKIILTLMIIVLIHINTILFINSLIKNKKIKVIEIKKKTVINKIWETLLKSNIDAWWEGQIIKFK